MKEKGNVWGKEEEKELKNAGGAKKRKKTEKEKKAEKGSKRRRKMLKKNAFKQTNKKWKME